MFKPSCLHTLFHCLHYLPCLHSLYCLFCLQGEIGAPGPPGNASSPVVGPKSGKIEQGPKGNKGGLTANENLTLSLSQSCITILLLIITIILYGVIVVAHVVRSFCILVIVLYAHVVDD